MSRMFLFVLPYLLQRNFHVHKSKCSSGIASMYYWPSLIVCVSSALSVSIRFSLKSSTRCHRQKDDRRGRAITGNYTGHVSHGPWHRGHRPFSSSVWLVKLNLISGFEHTGTESSNEARISGFMDNAITQGSSGEGLYYICRFV
jgi:hypothetical protein